MTGTLAEFAISRLVLAEEQAAEYARATETLLTQRERRIVHLASERDAWQRRHENLCRLSVLLGCLAAFSLIGGIWLW